MKTTIIALFAILLLMANACQTCPEKEELKKLKAQNEIEELNKKVATLFHHDLAVKKNWDVANEILAKNFIVHSPGMDDIKGRDAAMTAFKPIWSAMQNTKVKHFEEIAKGDYVFIRWSMEFENSVDLMGIPATGNKIKDIGGMDLFLMKDGKISEMWQYFDQLSYMQQLGVLPAPGH